jgi:hypothetical protein
MIEEELKEKMDKDKILSDQINSVKHPNFNQKQDHYIIEVKK